MRLRILQVGMGGFGTSWAARIIPRVEGAELVACVDIDPSSLERVRPLLHLPDDRYFLSLEEALESVEADAVLVTTVIAAHVPAALMALSAGKHVLMEKPFAPTLEEARQAVEAAERAGLVLMISQNYRFFPAVRAAQEMVSSGRFGQPSAVYLDFRRYDNSAPYGSHRHYHVPEPILVDMAIHHFDLMRAVLGREPREVSCRSWNPSWSKYDQPASAVATVRFDGDVVVSYRGSWLSPGVPTPWAGRWRMEFPEREVSWTSRGGVEMLDSEDAVSVRRLGGRSRGVALPKVSHLDRAGSLAAFAEAICSGVEPETSGRSNLPTLALTLAAVESAAIGAPVLL